MNYKVDERPKLIVPIADGKTVITLVADNHPDDMLVQFLFFIDSEETPIKYIRVIKIEELVAFRKAIDSALEMAGQK